MIIELQVSGYDLEVFCSSIVQETPAYVTGLPEDCYPAECGYFEYEIETATFIGEASEVIEISEGLTYDAVYDAVYDKLFG